MKAKDILRARTGQNLTEFAIENGLCYETLNKILNGRYSVTYEHPRPETKASRCILALGRVGVGRQLLMSTLGVRA